MVTVGSSNLLSRQPGCWYLAGLIHLVLTCVVTSNFATHHGRMTPPNPLVATGDTLELNCTLSDPLAMGKNASSLYFEPPGDVVVNLEYVTVLDEKTISLRYPNASKSLNGHWFCRQYEATDSLNFGQQSILVADKPVKPKITGCRVFNWQNMSCWWEPKDQTESTGIRTNQTLYWTLSLNTQQWSYCPHMDENYCSWRNIDKKDSFRDDMVYLMFIEAKNALGSIRSEAHTSQSQYIVEPAPVVNLMVNYTSKTTVKLKWKSPANQKEITYKVRYKSDRSSTWMEVNTTLLQYGADMTISGLTPYTRYTFNVTCIPRVGGFWSRPRVVTAMTELSVPHSAPLIPPGGFRVTTDQDNTTNRKVVIFWKSIPEEDRNGPIKEYRIRYDHGFGEAYEYGYDEKTLRVKPTDTTCTLTLNKDGSYRVYVDARTDIGYNTTLERELSPLLIQNEEELPPKPARFVSEALNETVVAVNWTAVPVAVGYTVYWCLGALQTLSCNEQLQWIHLDENTTSYNISLGDLKHVQFIFGVSVEAASSQNRTKRAAHRQVVSSGIDWSKCTYDITKLVIRPQNLQASEHQEHGALTVEWVHPQCSETAYADRYLIYYCPATECTGVKSDEDYAKRIEIDSRLEEYTIGHLNPSEDYYVWMYSVSPDGGESKSTKPLRETVHRSGLTKGKIAAICIGGIIVLFFIIFGLYQVMKSCRKKVEQEVKVTFKPPPEVSKEVMQRFDRHADTDEDYTITYGSMVGPEQQISEENHLMDNHINQDRELPQQPNGHVSARASVPSTPDPPPGKGRITSPSPCEVTGYLGMDQLKILEPSQLIARVYLGQGSAESKRLRNGQNSGEGLSSNDTVMTLLPQDSHGEPLDEEGHGSSPHSLQMVQEETNKDKRPATSQSRMPYSREANSGTSHQSGSTIPSYTKCGLPEDDESGAASGKTAKEPIYEKMPGDETPPKAGSPPRQAAGYSTLVENPTSPAGPQPPADPGYSYMNESGGGSQPISNAGNHGNTVAPHGNTVAPGSQGNTVAPYCQMISPLDYTNSPTGLPVSDNGNSPSNHSDSQQQEPPKGSSQQLPLPGKNPMDYQQMPGYHVLNGGVPVVDSPPGDIQEISSHPTTNTNQLVPDQSLPFTAGLPLNLMAKNNNNGYVTVNM